MFCLTVVLLASKTNLIAKMCFVNNLTEILLDAITLCQQCGYIINVHNSICSNAILRIVCVHQVQGNHYISAVLHVNVN